MSQESAAFEAPLVLPTRRVKPEWIDYNGHMNVAYYVLAFDNALDDAFDRLAFGVDYVRRTGSSFFVVEAHVTYAREVRENDPLRITFQLLGHDEKRLHYFMAMHHAEEGYLAATSEQLGLHVSLTTRRSAPMPAEMQARFAAMMAAHRALPRPAEAGRAIGLGTQARTARATQEDRMEVGRP